MTHVIYGLDRIGVNGTYEATGEVHFYCSQDHAHQHSITEGYRTSANYSKPKEADSADVADGTECEWCGKKTA